MDKYTYEVRLNKTKSRPKCVKFGAFRQWRWDVTMYEPVEGKYHGVRDARNHMGSRGMGYCFTKTGASIAAGKVIGSSYAKD